MGDKLVGASELEIFEEPDWAATHSHRVGTRGRDARFMGVTHPGDEWKEELEQLAHEKFNELREKVKRGELVTVRDMMNTQQDFHLDRPDVHPSYWRYVLHTTESFIKEEQPWPINIKKREKQQKAKEEEDRKKRELEEKKQQQQQKSQQSQDQMDVDKKEDGGEGGKEEPSKPRLSPEEQALLDCLHHEQLYRTSIKRNDGKGRSPHYNEELPEQIDEADQFTADNWIPRSDKLIRLTGKHPLNAEPDLTTLFEAGLITPSAIHYVRNHGAVPHLMWENHRLEVTAGKQLVFLLDDLKNQFESINIPVLLACDGTRRKELNMIKATRAFNYTAAASSCAYWKGVRLCDVLRDAEVDKLVQENPDSRFWVHYEGADELSEGKYATSVPLQYIMDPNNDVLLAYEMNDHPLPPDHGYPLRVIIPGWVGGRSVKWLTKVWVTDKENNSYYHIYDNRQLPSFVTDPTSELAETMFNHPSTICNEQMLNSVTVRPAQGEKINLVDIKKGKQYRIEGFAFNGSGEEVDKVEISLDGGETWLYCVRKYPEAPVRHGHKFWTWLHWHVDLEITKLIRAESIIVRAFDVHKNTQPPKPVWNIQGMMNNCWYTIKIEVYENHENEEAYLYFRHPVEPGNGVNGWMKPSTEQQIEEVKRQAASPEKQFTRQEIEKHHTEDDCWIVVNGKVYDATSVLSWHPGGKGPLLAHAGAVHLDTTDEFEGIHDDFARDKLKDCILGKVTTKAMDHMKKEAEQKAKERAQTGHIDPEVALNKHKWIQAKLINKVSVSPDTHRYTFGLPGQTKRLGLEIGQHFMLGFHFHDRLITRTYTPVRPIMDEEDDGTFDLVVKTYYPDANQPGGTMSNILDCLRIGQEVEVKGPAGDIRYHGNGEFMIENTSYKFNNITLILGGSGVTPGYQVISRILRDENDKTKVKVIDANNTEADILLRGDFEEFSKKHPDQFEITYVLAFPDENWEGYKGFVTEDIIKKHAFEPADKNVALLCGPPAMIQKAVLPALKDWGYEEDRNVFGF